VEDDVEEKRMVALNLDLTGEQQEKLKAFWAETGSLGTAEVMVKVEGDKISPAAIQVGTAK